MERDEYATLFGPTKGDRFRLADTSLICEVEEDVLTYGDEGTFGGGKSIRDGMGQTPGLRNDEGCLDLVITNVVVMDPHPRDPESGHRREGRAHRRYQEGRQPVRNGQRVAEAGGGAGTEVIAGVGRIAAPGAVDTHIHYLCPQQIPEALSNGTTTLIGGGTGPA